MRTQIGLVGTSDWVNEVAPVQSLYHRHMPDPWRQDGMIVRFYLWFGVCISFDSESNACDLKCVPE